eukprot:m.216143 g.216143  ORF g.216143 m.216143 type:complete len:179 (+) comp18651_c0_seq1:2112-2648(+)
MSWAASRRPLAGRSRWLNTKTTLGSGASAAFVGRADAINCVQKSAFSLRSAGGSLRLSTTTKTPRLAAARLSCSAAQQLDSRQVVTFGSIQQWGTVTSVFTIHQRAGVRQQPLHHLQAVRVLDCMMQCSPLFVTTGGFDVCTVLHKQLGSSQVVVFCSTQQRGQADVIPDIHHAGVSS